MAGRIAYYGNIVKDGLVLDLDAAKKDSYPGTGTVWSDISGNGYNGTLTNGPTFTTVGGGIVYDGTNDYVVGNNSLASSISNAITLIVWARISNMNNRVPLFTKYQTSGIVGYTLEVGTLGGLWDRTIRFYAGDSNWASYAVDSRGNTPLADNTTYMFTVRYQTGTLIKTYYNLTEMTTYTLGTNWQLTTNFAGGSNVYYLGAYSPSVGVYGNSTIYNTMVYNRVLSIEELTQNYNALKGRYGL